MDEINIKLASTLRFLYSDSGLSYTQISKQTGLSRATIVRVINGERDITVLYLEKLCKVFGVLPSSLLKALEQ